MLKRILICLSLCLSFQCKETPKQTAILAEVSPKDVGLSETQLANIDTLFNEYIKKDWMPGGTVLVARKGQVAYFKTFGKKDFKKPYQKDDIFRLASMTKAVTTVAILQQWEKGKFQLDDPISMYLPEFKTQNVLDTFNEKDSTYTSIPVKSPITIRQLLTHTSGIYYGDFSFGKLKAIYTKADLLESGLSHNKYNNKQFIEILGQQPLAFQPGTQWMYGLNMEVLGYLVETLSGLTLEDYFNQNIFEPLDMEDTFFYVPKEKEDRLVPVYTEENDTIIMNPRQDYWYPKGEHRFHFAGGGGLSGTTMDYARFCQALLNGGKLNGKRILGRKTIELMTSNQMLKIHRANNTPDEGVAQTLGFNVVTQGGPKKDAQSPGSYSWGGYFNTQFYIDPEEEIVFVGMTQIHPTWRWEFWEKMKAIVYSSVE
ncbi:CubicO group peptidase (beta-lactamase class C family) [Flavobacteriaceae bacterium MAR_2010_72]|nr:CubicO group peptidase (beta-lactamase class C family) [Flavobacteriaceae bacterium MAR_2010_72]